MYRIRAIIASIKVKLLAGRKSLTKFLSLSLQGVKKFFAEKLTPVVRETWEKLPPLPWLRRGIAAGLVAMVCFPVIAFLGGEAPLEFKMPGAGRTEPERSFDDKSLSIMQAIPEGKIEPGQERKEVFIVFSHPIIPLGALETTAKGVFSITPKIAGEFRWYGSRITAFVPSEDWRPGIEYTVRIHADTTAVSGQKLKEKKIFRFRMEIPPLSVQNLTPGKESKIKYDEHMTLSFNFAVREEALRENLRLKEEKTNIPFTVRESREVDWRGRATKRDGRTWEIIPGKKFSKGKTVELFVGKGLKAKDPETGLSDNYEASFETYGDLTVEFKDAAKSWADRYYTGFDFSNPVNPKAAARAIKFTPPRKVIHLPYGETKHLNLSSWNVEPGQTYKISIQAMSDVMGNPLKAAGPFEVTMPDRERFFHRVESGTVIEAEMKQNYPLNLSNIEQMTALVRPFTLAEVLDFSTDKNSYSLNDFLEIKGNAQQATFTTGIRKNGIGRAAFNLAPYLTKGRGWVAARFAGGSEREAVSQAIQATDLALTARPALGGNHVWVHSLSFGNAIANARVTRYTNEKRDGDCATNAEGYCLIAQGSPRDDGDSLVFTAEKDGDKAFVTSKEQRLSIQPAGGDFAYRTAGSQLKGIIVFDRKLHTPGDTVYFKAVLSEKRADKLHAFADSKVKVEVSSAEGKTVYTKSLTTSAQGGVGGEVEIPRDAPLGHYTLTVTGGKDMPQSIQDTFQIEEFRPVNFAVAVTGMTDSVAGKTAEATVEGNYLFGAPMQRARFQVDVSRSKAPSYFSNYPDFNFGDLRYSYYGESDETDTGFFTGTKGRLLANGRHTLRIPLTPMAFSETIDLPEKTKFRYAHSYTVNVEATVKDVDDKSVSNRRSIHVAAGKHVVGIRSKDTYGKTGDEMNFEIVALDTAGKSAGNVPVKITILHVTWKSVRTLGAEEALQTKNTPVRRVVAQQSVSAGEKPAPFSFTPDKGGEYYIIAQPEGDLSFARTGFYVSGESDGYYMRNDDTVSIVADKTKYAPGDTARILVQSPVKTGRIILSLEREKVYWQKQIEISDYSVAVPVEIKEEYLPNVYLTALVIKPREKLSKRTLYEDLGAPAFKIGSLNLAVDTASRKAKFDLSYDRQHYGPGDTVKMTIQTERDAEIALSVADRAVLDLVDYHFPNPVSGFFGTWPLAIELFENRHAIIHQYDFAGKGNAPGGGPGEAGEGMGQGGFALGNEDGTRKNFRYTAFWESSLKADKAGNVQVTFKLPDNLSTFRIMALAAAGGKYSSYEKEFQVRKALVVQPLMPRFIRAGDELMIGAVVINQTGVTADFEVNLASDLLAGGGDKTVRIAAGESREVNFAAKVNMVRYAHALKAYREKAQDAKAEKPSEHPVLLSGFVTARAADKDGMAAKGLAAADITDRVKFELPVLEAPSVEAFAIAGFTDDKIRESLRIPAEDEILGNMGSLDLTLSSTALVGLDKAFRFYGSNPYFCMEQRASAFMLAITSGQMLQSFAVKPSSSDNYDFRQIESLFLGEIGEFVNADGGLRFWKKNKYSDEKSNPYLSAYVLTVLQAAEAKNFSVNRSVRKGIVDYLQNFLRTEMQDKKSTVLENLSLVNLALTREGAIRSDLTKFLLKNEAELSTRAKARLALAIAHREKLRSYTEDSDVKRLFEHFKNRLEITATSVALRETNDSGLRQTFYSGTSALALVLQAYITLDRDNPLIPQMVNHLLKETTSYDTHSIGLSATALDTYRTVHEAGGQPFSFLGDISLGEKRLFSASLSSHKFDVFRKSLTIPEVREAGKPGATIPFVFSKSRDKGRLYYAARLNYAAIRGDQNARDEGIEIHRNLFAMENVRGRQITRPIKEHQMKRGELYLQKIMVTAPKSYYNVVLVDPLASQTEVMNAAFNTEKAGSAQTTDRPGGDGEGEEARYHEDESYYWGSAPSFQEYRHDKVVMFFNYLPAGYHEYRYVVRPLVRGKSIHPPGQVKLMYEPEIFGRSAATQTRVE